jgi:hypothetical protein
MNDDGSRPLSTEECWSRLGRHAEGTDEHWPARLPTRLLWLPVEEVTGEVEPVAATRKGGPR